MGRKFRVRLTLFGERVGEWFEFAAFIAFMAVWVAFVVGILAIIWLGAWWLATQVGLLQGAS